MLVVRLEFRTTSTIHGVISQFKFLTLEYNRYHCIQRECVDLCMRNGACVPSASTPTPTTFLPLHAAKSRRSEQQTPQRVHHPDTNLGDDSFPCSNFLLQLCLLPSVLYHKRM